MTLESVYHIGQTLMFVGILAALIMLLRQMRKNQKLNHATVQRDLLLRLAEWHRKIYQTPASFDAFVLGLQEYENATALIQLHIDKNLVELVFICESALNMRRDGISIDTTKNGIEDTMISILRTKGGKQWWQHAQKWISSDLKLHLKKGLDETDPATPDFFYFQPTFRKRLHELSEIAQRNSLRSAG